MSELRKPGPKCTRKRRFLTYREQAEVIKKIKSGVSRETVMRDYGISHSQCYKLSQREEIIFNKINSYETADRKTSKASEDRILDEAMITWYEQTRLRGDPISGPIIQEKARIFNEKLNFSSTFKASTGWLRNFKRRYGISLNGLIVEKISSDPQNITNFSYFLKEKIAEENLSLANIYNADKSDICWKPLVTNQDAQHKENEDRVSGFFCANASGSHRIPLLIIGKEAVPRCLNKSITPNLKKQRLKFLKSYDITYTHETNASMNAEIFKLWYALRNIDRNSLIRKFTELFIPSVSEHQTKPGTSGKVILILDNDPCYPNLNMLNALNPKFEVVYSSSSDTSIVQPMNHGAISLTKRLYKQTLLRRALIADEKTVKFLNEMTLCDCFVQLNDAWKMLRNSTLNRMWKSLLGETCIIDPNAILVDGPSTREEETFPNEICDELCQVLAQSEYPVESLKKLVFEWFHSDDSNCNWEQSKVDGNARSVTSGNVETANIVNNEEHGNDLGISQFSQISASEALKCLRKFKNWMLRSAAYSSHHSDCLQEMEKITIKKIENFSVNNAHLNP